MIEKLPFTEIHTGGEDMVDLVEFQPVSPYEMQHKINELVDAVNKLQTKVNKMAQNLDFTQPEVKENVQDKFAEQRKWVGKVCKFWNWDTGLAHYSKLITIKDINDGEMSNCPFRADDGGWYMYCEPVKPDDPVIYKGE